jgi:hypothetical protein
LITSTKKEISMDTNDVKEVKDLIDSKESTDPEPVELLKELEASEVAGGAGDCGTVVQLGYGGTFITSHYPNLPSALRGTYDGFVEGTSHIIETVAKSIKPL